MSVIIKNIEQRRFSDWLKSQSKENQDKCRNLIARSTEMIVRGAMDKAPVDEGRLRSSIKPKYSADKLSSEVSVNVIYGPYMEFGTGEAVEIPDGLEDYALQFKGKGIRKVNIEPKPYFFGTFERVATAFVRELEKMGFDARPQ